MLPVVKRETIQTLYRDFRKDKLSFGREKWCKMALDNEKLFLAISDASNKMQSDGSAERFLRGAFFVYALLDAQVEIDNLEENWGNS